jgi:hypothetical protein
MKLVSILICMLTLVTVGMSQQWEYINAGMTAQYTYDIAFNGPYVFVGTSNGVYRSSNRGGMWERGINNNEFTHGLEVIDGMIYSFNGNGVMRSTDNGATWLPILSNQMIRAMVKINNTLFAASGGGILKSINDGATWTLSNGAIYPDGSDGRLSNTGTHTLVVQGSDMYTGTFGGSNGGIFCSRDYGAHWQLWENNGKKYVWDMFATGTAIFAAVSNDAGPMGILRCTNRVNWDSKNVGIVNPYIQSLGAYGSTVYAGNMTHTPQGAVGGPYRSTNRGDSWVLFNQGLTSSEISGINSDGVYVYVANWDKGVARFPVIPITTEGSLKLTLYAADPWGLLGQNSRVKLYDNGYKLVDEKWAEPGSIVNFTNVKAGTYQYEVYNTRSNPWGEMYCGWKGNIIISAGIQTIDVFKHNTPVMPAARVYINSPNQEVDNGVNVPVGTLMRVEIDVWNPNYSGADNTNAFTKIYLDRDELRTETAPYTFDVEGLSPTLAFLKGQTRTTVTYFAIPANGGGTYSLSCGTFAMFSGGPLLTDGGGWIGPVFTITGTSGVDIKSPETYTVLQNYPNPFNPSTTIEYSVKHTDSVRLTVVDMLGRETVLVDETQSVGTYKRSWFATTSGTYFAVLSVNGTREVIRMLALK